MSTRARSHRPAPWKIRGWTPAPNALTPAEVVAAMVAPPAPASSLPDNLRCFQVGVSPRRRGGYEAHVKFCPGWVEMCIHGISATSGAEAKALGIAEHIRVCIQGGKP